MRPKAYQVGGQRVQESTAYTRGSSWRCPVLRARLSHLTVVGLRLEGNSSASRVKKLGFILKFGNCREYFYLGITTMQFTFQKDHSGKKEESSGGL